MRIIDDLIVKTATAILRDDFEAWVKNPHLLNRRTEPGYTDEYEHPWTCGAWAAWKECHERAKPRKDLFNPNEQTDKD